MGIRFKRKCRIRLGLRRNSVGRDNGSLHNDLCGEVAGNGGSRTPLKRAQMASGAKIAFGSHNGDFCSYLKASGRSRLHNGTSGASEAYRGSKDNVLGDRESLRLLI